MFGFGKRKCKECGAELGDMEALRDRADDLMKSSALGSAEPMVDTCARCRAKLTKGTQSLAMNLHVIEARRAEAEAETAATAPDQPVPAERNVAQIVDAPPAETKTAYQPGGGFRTESELPEMADGTTSFADVKNFGSFLVWLVTTKSGRNAAWVVIILLFVGVNMCSSMSDYDPVEAPVATEMPPPTVEPPLEEPEPPEEPVEAPVPTVPARPANNPATWATTVDYPSRALNEGREGTVGFLLTINTQGVVTECAITESSGHADLDAATCSVISRRARFERSQVGSPDRGYRNRVTWRIPE